MVGQGCIVATGAIRDVGDARVMTLTSTYDHRVIQGAESGAFLRRVAPRCWTAPMASTTRWRPAWAPGRCRAADPAAPDRPPLQPASRTPPAADPVLAGPPGPSVTVSAPTWLAWPRPWR